MNLKLFTTNHDNRNNNTANETREIHETDRENIVEEAQNSN